MDEGEEAQKHYMMKTLVKEHEDPYTLLSYVTPDIRDFIAAIPEELTNIDEEELLNTLSVKYLYEPTNLVLSLRVRFWAEFDVAFAKKQQMNMSNVYLGLCSRAHFYHICSKSPHQIAYVICEPPDYKTALEGLEPLQLRLWKNILSIPTKDAGKLQDPKILELQHKVALAIDLRQRGGYLNRSETKNLTMLHQKSEHTYTQGVQTPLAVDTSTMTAAQIESAIQEEILKLEGETRAALPPPVPQFESPDPVDAEFKESDAQ